MRDPIVKRIIFDFCWTFVIYHLTSSSPKFISMRNYQTFFQGGTSVLYSHQLHTKVQMALLLATFDDVKLLILTFPVNKL